MADETAVPPGVVVCDDFTKGRKAPRTVSRIPNGPQLWWGRQDFAVYIVAIPPFLLALITVGWWWPLVIGTFPGVPGAMISIALLIGIPVAAGATASTTGLNSRDIPRHLDSVWARRPRLLKAEAAFNRGAPEPRLRLHADGWLLPEPKPIPTIVKYGVRVPFQGVVELCESRDAAVERAAHYPAATVTLARPDVVAEYESRGRS